MKVAVINNETLEDLLKYADLGARMTRTDYSSHLHYIELEDVVEDKHTPIRLGVTIVNPDTNTVMKIGNSVVLHTPYIETECDIKDRFYIVSLIRELILKNFTMGSAFNIMPHTRLAPSGSYFTGTEVFVHIFLLVNFDKNKDFVLNDSNKSIIFEEIFSSDRFTNLDKWSNLILPTLKRIGGNQSC